MLETFQFPEPVQVFSNLTTKPIGTSTPNRAKTDHH